MTKTAWWIIILIVVVALAGGIWWWMSQSQHGVGSYSPAANTSSTQPTGDSDQAISQEMTNVNAQMDGLSSDSASINQGLNDQPVEQSQF